MKVSYCVSVTLNFLSHYFSLKIKVLCTAVITESLFITNKASTHEFDWEFMHFNRHCDEIVIFFLGASDTSPSTLTKRTLLVGILKI